MPKLEGVKCVCESILSCVTSWRNLVESSMRLHWVVPAEEDGAKTRMQREAKKPGSCGVSLCRAVMRLAEICGSAYATDPDAVRHQSYRLSRTPMAFDLYQNRTFLSARTHWT
jgi:hypothetical protein